MKFVLSIIVSTLFASAYTSPIKEPPNSLAANVTSNPLSTDKPTENIIAEGSFTTSLPSQLKDANCTTNAPSSNLSVSSTITVTTDNAPKPEAMAIAQNEQPISSTPQVDKYDGDQGLKTTSPFANSTVAAENKSDNQADSPGELKQSSDGQKDKDVSDEKKTVKPQDVSITTVKSGESTVKLCSETTSASVDHQKKP